MDKDRAQPQSAAGGGVQPAAGTGNVAPSTQQSARSERARLKAEESEAQIKQLAGMSAAMLVLTIATFIASLYTDGGSRAVTSAGASTPWIDIRTSHMKARETHLNVQASLRQLYLVETVNISYHRSEICSVCGGQGGTGHARCEHCGGRGWAVGMQHIGGGMMRQVQTTCGACGGSGRTIAHRCHSCGGSKVHHHVPVTVSVQLNPGLRAGDVIRLPGWGDQHPGADSGDVMVSIEEIEEEFDIDRFQPGVLQPRITRRPVLGPDGHPAAGSEGRGLDLATEIEIGLAEALRGFKRRILHLNGQTLTVSAKGPTDPGSEIVLRACGMLGRPGPGTGLWSRVLPSKWGQRETGAQILVEQQRPGLDKAIAWRAEAAGTGSPSDSWQGAVMALASRAKALVSGVGSGLQEGSCITDWPAPVGDLYVRVKVQFPRELTREQRAVLDKVL